MSERTGRFGYQSSDVDVYSDLSTIGNGYRLNMRLITSLRSVERPVMAQVTAGSSVSGSRPRAAIQLHTLRDMEAPLSERVRRIADAGFEGIEFVFGHLVPVSSHSSYLSMYRLPCWFKCSSANERASAGFIGGKTSSERFFSPARYTSM